MHFFAIYVYTVYEIQPYLEHFWDTYISPSTPSTPTPLDLRPTTLDPSTDEIQNETYISGTGLPQWPNVVGT